MAKRIMEDLKGEHYEIDFKYDNEENQLRKKIKLENEKIINKIKDIEQDIDISEHEVQKFLLIFHTLMETVNSEQTQEETDGVVIDVILQIVIKIGEPLKKNIDLLNLPAVLKNKLKKTKSLFMLQTNTEWDKQNAEEASETAREGRKEQWSNKNKK